MERKCWHTVVFKGGGKAHFKASNVKVERRGSTVTSVTVVGSRFVFLDIDQIVAIWLGKV